MTASSHTVPSRSQDLPIEDHKQVLPADLTMKQLTTRRGATPPHRSESQSAEGTAPSAQLPLEIWSRIIKMAKKPKPSASESSIRGRRISSLRQYGQGDLTVCMRVCKGFYHITAPILYAEVIVDDLVQFFHGVDVPTVSDTTSTLPIQSGISSKTELLKYVKAFHLVHGQRKAKKLYGPIPPIPQADIPLAMISDCKANSIIVSMLLGPWCQSSKTPLLFPNLDVTSTGAYGSSTWDLYAYAWFRPVPERPQDICAPDADTDTAWWAQAQSNVNSDFLARYMGYLSAPRYACSYVNNGPQTYIPPNSSTISSYMSPKCKPNLEYYTCHITQRMVESRSKIRLIDGQLNRWVVSSEFSSRSAHANSEMVWWLGQQISHANRRLSSTEQTLEDPT
ncbi:hypothetical protein V866_008560 [Kwoniella sp. B9012]